MIKIGNINFLKILKNKKISNIVYLSSVILFFLIVLILFLYSTSNIISNVNKIFSTENNSNPATFNAENYLLIEKKLNLIEPTSTTTPVNQDNKIIDTTKNLLPKL